MSDHQVSSTNLPIMECIEAILFVAASPVTPNQLALTLGRSLDEVNEGLKELERHYCLQHALTLQRLNGKVQITTAPTYANVVENFLGLEATARLSRAALETLAIIAYRQPVTRPAIDAIRGVNSDGVLKSLLGKGLIEEMGRAEGPGRPILYGVTAEFLQNFGLSSLAQLPPYEIPVDDKDELQNGSLKENGLLKD